MCNKAMPQFGDAGSPTETKAWSKSTVHVCSYEVETPAYTRHFTVEFRQHQLAATYNASLSKISNPDE